MKKRYRSAAVKAVVTIVAICSMAAGIVSGIWLLSAGLDAKNIPFEESEDFNNMVENAITSIVESHRANDMFGTSGQYDPDKIVDIVEYADKGTISGKNESGIAYTLSDLYDWGESGVSYLDSFWVECVKPDGGSYYYSTDDFERLVNSKELNVEISDYITNADDFITMLSDGQIFESVYGRNRVYDREGELLYIDCFNNYELVIQELYSPIGADDLLGAINDNDNITKEIGDVITALSDTINDIYQQLSAYMNRNDAFLEGNTNFTYYYIKEDGAEAYTNSSDCADMSLNEVRKSLTSYHSSRRYVLITPQLDDFKTDMNLSAQYMRDCIRAAAGSDWDGVFIGSVDISYPVQDSFYAASLIYNENLNYLNVFRIIAVVSLICWIVSTVWITAAAGRTDKDDELHLNRFDRWKTEIAAAVMVGIGAAIVFIIVSNWHVVTNLISNQYVVESPAGSGLSAMRMSGIVMIYISLCSLAGSAAFYAGYLSLVKRIKKKTLWANSLARIAVNFTIKIFNNRSLTTKGILILAAFVIIHWLTAVSKCNPVFVILTVIADLAALWMVVNNAIERRKITDGIERIASGDTGYRIELVGLRGSNLTTAEAVNNIGNGIQLAVDEALKGERLKTQLITNVSHDIKTPLTSIINYIDLLKRENIDDEKIRKYLTILEEKAFRLKTLTEDVVEASKVSSGNIELELTNVNFAEIIRQTEGEYEERFKDRSLTLISSLPEEAVMIHADGKRMWRVLSNLYSNAAKYAMPGTRVYSELKAADGKAVFSLKNISEQPLNIPVQELKERFIRGDEARSSEGSGLGLSIAEDLVKLQGGQLEIFLDGDLFKAEISLFDLCNRENRQDN